MRLDGCDRLPLGGEHRTAYRTIDQSHFRSPLYTKQSLTHRGRFNPGSGVHPWRRFEVLYLSQNHLISGLEAQWLFGDPYDNFYVPGRLGTLVTLNVEVSLRFVTDLTIRASQKELDISAQELTGDWRSYQHRSRKFPIMLPRGIAPTQLLGMRLFQRSQLEGFFYVSAKDGRYWNLAIFPDKLQYGSYVQWIDERGIPHRITAGGVRTP